MESKEGHLSTADLAGAKQKRDRNPQVEPEFGNEIRLDRDNSGRPDVKRTDAPSQAPDLVPLFSHEAVQDFRSRWTALQTGFVDEPRRAVQDADELVAQVIKQLAETFSAERAKLEKQWDQGDKVSTEDLRLVLRRYRAFFDRFLSV